MDDQSNPVATENAEMAAKVSGRRRFVRGVGLAAPVVLTMASRSALASTATCLSPSAQASIALDKSRPDRNGAHCSGSSPGYWKNAKQTHPVDWQASGAEGVLFSTIFGSGFPNKTLLQVIQLGGQEDQWQLGAHLVAAWCNLRTEKVPDAILSLDTLKKMWDGRNGSYEPVPGVFWNGQQIVDYIVQATFSD